MGDDVDETVVGLEFPGGGNDLQGPQVFLEMDRGIQVGRADDVVVGDTDGADAGRGEVVHECAADGACADDKDAGVLQKLLAFAAEFRDHALAGISFRVHTDVPSGYFDITV